MKIGRNEPCPCGSGKKYKRCCGAGAQYVSAPAPSASVETASNEETELGKALARAARVAKAALRAGKDDEAEKGALAALIAGGMSRDEARKEARGILAEALGNLEGEQEMKNAEARARRAGKKAFATCRATGEDVLACREKARAAILASFEAGGAGFAQDAPLVVRLLDSISRPHG